MAKVDKEKSEAGPAELPADLSYEAALAQLEQIIASLETGELKLEEALARNEEGAS